MALLEGHVGPVWSLSYSRGAGSILASGGADRTLRLFSCPRGASVLELVNDELLAAATQVQHAGEGGGGASGGAAGASGGAAGASGGAAGGGDAAAAAGGHQQHQQHHQWQPWQLLETYTTQAMPVIYASFSPRNLLRAGGPWTLPPKTVGGGVAGVVGVGI
jgi:WD40 repeat protein